MPQKGRNNSPITDPEELPDRFQSNYFKKVQQPTRTHRTQQNQENSTPAKPAVQHGDRIIKLNQTETLELRNATADVSGRLNPAEERICELQGRSFKISPVGEKRKKNEKGKKTYVNYGTPYEKNVCIWEKR